jgi:DNA polymerase I-like protein with 3'-5' exonuclease and polymerase domains
MYGLWGLPIQRTKSKEAGATTNELALVRLQHYVGSDYARTNQPGAWTEDSRCTPRFFDLVLRLRGCSKLISTYVQPVAMNETLWIHPSYMPVSKDEEHVKKDTGLGLETAKGTTCTGRLATYGPNIQNQPKKVRKLYVPDTFDMTFIQADYKSAELYVMAYMADDDRLLADLRSGDMHSRNAVRFNTTRKTAKNITYAGQYLAGAAKVSEMLLEQEHQYVPVEECKRILSELAKYYYKTHAYKMHLVQMCESKKHIKNAFGRIRFFHAGNAPAAVDFIPQSTVADVLWCVLARVAQMARSFGGRMTTTVHDSILIQVPSARVAEAAAEMKAIMETRFDIVKPGFYIPVEVEMAAPGKSWGHVEPYAMAA